MKRSSSQELKDSEKKIKPSGDEEEASSSAAKNITGEASVEGGGENKESQETHRETSTPKEELNTSQEVAIDADSQGASGDNQSQPEKTENVSEMVVVKEEKPEKTWEGRWQLIPTTVRQRMNYLLTTSKLSDCKFLIGKPDCQQEFKLHSTILAMSSPEFDDLLSETKEIRVADVEPEVFKQVLEYVYLDYVNLWSVEKTQLLYRASVKFKLPHLCEKAVEYMMAKMSLDSVWPIFDAAIATQDQILTNECKKFFQKNIAELLRHPKFPTVDQTVIASLVSDDNLGVPEADLIQGVMKWAHRKCLDIDIVPSLENKRSVLVDGTLSRIRFLALSKEFFVKHVAYSKSKGDEGILTMEESYAILMNMIQHNSYPMPEGFTTCSKERSTLKETTRLIRRLFNPLGTYQPAQSPRIDKLTVLAGPTLAAPYGCKSFFLDLVVSKDITLFGIQVPTFFPGLINISPAAIKVYEESYIVSVQNNSQVNKPVVGSINWSGKVNYSSFVDLIFKDSIRLDKNQNYTVMVYTNNTYYLNQKLCTVEEAHGVRFTLKDSVTLLGKPGKQDYAFISQIIYAA